MTLKKFIGGLILAIVVSLFIVFLLQLVDSTWVDWTFISICILFFLLLSIVMYVYAVKTTNDQNPYKFSRYFLLFSFLKIVGSLLIILLYFKMASPVGKYILISFIAVYIVFTILETTAYTSLSGRKHKDRIGIDG